MFAQATQKKMDEQAKKNQDIIIKLQADSFKEIMSYSRFFALAGYASYFTVWSKVYIEYNKTAMLCSVTCLLSSVILFICWEYYKMHLYTKWTVRAQNILKSAANPIQFLEEWQKNESLLKKEEISISTIYHVLVNYIIFPLAFFGTGILLCCLFQDIFIRLWEFKNPLISCFS